LAITYLFFQRKGAEGLDIAFLHPKSTGGVLIELCENKG